MVTMSIFTYQSNQKGGALLEVLITIIILAVGLLGLAGLQLRLQQAEMNSYQRAQALVLLNDMVSRLSANRNNAADYITSNPVGVGVSCPTDIATQPTKDISEWCNLLQGASEQIGSTTAGAMLGGRGCIERVGLNTYMITVAWQGLTAVSAPPTSVTCGVNLYNSPVPGAKCINDLCRMTVTRIVRIAQL
jgi:type IV pilus assembly protein PilV